MIEEYGGFLQNYAPYHRAMEYYKARRRVNCSCMQQLSDSQGNYAKDEKPTSENYRLFLFI